MYQVSNISRPYALQHQAFEDHLVPVIGDLAGRNARRPPPRCRRGSSPSACRETPPPLPDILAHVKPSFMPNCDDMVAFRAYWIFAHIHRRRRPFGSQPVGSRPRQSATMACAGVTANVRPITARTHTPMGPAPVISARLLLRRIKEAPLCTICSTAGRKRRSDFVGISGAKPIHRVSPHIQRAAGAVDTDALRRCRAAQVTTRRRRRLRQCPRVMCPSAETSRLS